MELRQEAEPLLGNDENPFQQVQGSKKAQSLTFLFSVACIVDQFGVSPMITLPRAIIICGWVGFPLAIVVFLVSVYTAMLLGRCLVIAESLDHVVISRARYPFHALVTMAWGKTAGSFAGAYVNFSLFFTNIPSLVIASQNLQSLELKISLYEFNLSYCYWLIILGLISCPLTWLGSPKDMKWVSVLSSGSTIVSVVIIWVCMLWDDTTAFSYRDIPSANWQSISIAYGILAFQLSCHPTILAIQVDMKDKRELSQTILLSFFVTGGLFLVTSLLARSLYGGGVQANLTEGLPNNLALFIAIGIVTLQLFLTSIVGGVAIFQDIEDKLGVPDELCWQRCALRTVIVMLQIFIAEILPRFDIVMGLLGGFFISPIVFITPPLMYYKLRSMLPLQSGHESSKRSRLGIKEFLRKHFFSLEINLSDGGLNASEKGVVCLLVIFGVICSFSAVYYSLRGAVWTSRFIPPCIFNVKAASFIVG